MEVREGSPSALLPSNFKYRKSITVNCRCGKPCTYTPRDRNKLPKRPKTKCSECGRTIFIKETQMINLDHYLALDHFCKIQEKKDHLLKIHEERIILNWLDKGLYAQEISQKTSFSVSFLSRKIHLLKEMGFITQIKSYPKTYKVTSSGRSFLEKGIYAEKYIPKETKEKRIKSVWIDKLRPHFYRFKNKLIYKPSWLYQITRRGMVRGLDVQRVEMHNWTKFIIRFNYQDFNGLENVEVCNNTIVYNFNRNIEDQYVYSKQELIQYGQNRIQDCKNVREFLEHDDFVIDKADPTLCQRPQYAHNSQGSAKLLGSLGKDILLTITTPEETRSIDDSPGKLEGEEETTSLEKAKAVFDVPEKIDSVQEETQEIKQEIKELRKEIKNLTQTLINLANNSNSDQKQTPEGFYQ